MVTLDSIELSEISMCCSNKDNNRTVFKSFDQPTALEIQARQRHERKLSLKREKRERDRMNGDDVMDWFKFGEEEKKEEKNDGMDAQKCPDSGNEAEKNRQRKNAMTAGTSKPNNTIYHAMRATQALNHDLRDVSRKTALHNTRPALPKATCTPSSRYGSRRSGVCQATDQTNARRTLERVLNKRIPQDQ